MTGTYQVRVKQAIPSATSVLATYNGWRTTE